MTSLLVLIPVSLGMGLIGLYAFFWAIRHDQFNDPEGNAWRVIAPEDPPETEGSHNDHMAPHPEDRNAAGRLELAVKMARVAIRMTQPVVRDRLRPAYAEDADALIASSQGWWPVTRIGTCTGCTRAQAVGARLSGLDSVALLIRIK